MPEPLLIVGTGALATLFAARLSTSGVPVAMLGSWPEGLAALERRGARLLNPGGSLLSGEVHVARSPQDLAQHQFALVLVKSWQSRRAGEQLAACLAPDGVALTLQNGLGNAEALADQLGAHRVAVGVTTTGGALLEPGLVRFGGEGSLEIAAMPRLDPLVAALRNAGFDVKLHSELRGLQWGKLVVNSAINPLTALFSLPNGQLLVDPTVHQILQRTARETASVAAAQKIELPYTDPVLMVEQVARQTAANRSSMLQDLQRGAPTEIEAINGAVVRAAIEVGLEARLNRQLLELVRARVRRHMQTSDTIVVPGRIAA
jgi:2-dehydropantoate 2-reductase